ncbi:hypothetical protein [Brevibacillus parabrevis]|uniref:hypothetical protein n=1 Tax=Brevibacillus parabrevis TaxID=54914 RepID=UPI0012F5128B|nr:hypothetical protein [Brevibacillus parabrevis]
MPTSLSYIFYSVFSFVSFLLYLVLALRGAGWRKRKRQIAVALALFLLVQLFFWNREYQHVVKSYLAPSHSFQCEKLKLPLPERTVFEGKTDGCSPFYRTFIDESRFIAYYGLSCQVTAT